MGIAFFTIKYTNVFKYCRLILMRILIFLNFKCILTIRTTQNKRQFLNVRMKTLI